MKKLTTSLILLLIFLTTSAHVGSPGVTFEGTAGPYKAIINITPPDVIPGTATVTVYLEDAPKGLQVSARPIYWTVGKDGTPSADIATPSATEQGRYDVKVWFMSIGASSIEVIVDGPKGKGVVLVPVMALSTAKRSMPAGLGWGLLAMAAFLVILMVTIIGSSVGDSQLNPGDEMTQRLRRRRVIGSVVSLVLLVLILWGGKNWWDSEAEDYKSYLFKPMQATTTVDAGNGTLTFSIDTAQLKYLGRGRRMGTTRKMNYIVPDHGKLMHLFLVRAGDLDVFAHLHPRRADSVTFISKVPKLPAGKYFVYADITRLSGFTETIVDTLDVKENLFRNAALEAKTETLADPDDTYYTNNPMGSRALTRPGAAMCGLPGVAAQLNDGSSAIWLQDPKKPIQANELTTLNFEIKDPEGKPAVLEPYMGMMAHAVILKDDGSVYIHLHPAGSYSMASQKALLDRIAFNKPLDEYLPKPSVFADSIDHFVAKINDMPAAERDKLLMTNMSDMKSDGKAHHQVSFPYTFPQPGKYRIWIQAKRNGNIINSAFDAEIK
ncbi:hypothetical protein [Mucilaginibacter myungsuensis]|uniref:Uncharacterized protein n=1 Tax=Mucilaginibacter myungsuensis TaxID=649104 RepID=A0A929L0T3_9SPHI|nr:hypothetical protein [Mucilaginibacter myungsuensis]MBE9662040.1 hypothetical protein [Mucilaginibacter myungsuensis]MDN3599527.1 hypothetical protein [Mucilaginibacter myungsuensis]